MVVSCSINECSCLCGRGDALSETQKALEAKGQTLQRIRVERNDLRTKVRGMEEKIVEQEQTIKARDKTVQNQARQIQKLQSKVDGRKKKKKKKEK